MPHLLGVLWLTATSAHAEPLPLPLAEAVELARARHVDVLEASIRRDQSEAQVRLARSAFAPTLSAGADLDASQSKGFLAGFPSSGDASGWGGTVGLSGRTALGTTWSVSTGLDRNTSSTLASLGGAPTLQEQATWANRVDLSARQDLLAMIRSDAGGAGVAAQRLGQQESEAFVRLAEQTAVAEVALAWWTLWLAVAQVDVAQEDLRESTSLLTQTQAWLDVGSIAPLEESRVSAETLGAELDLLSAQNQAHRARRILAGLLSMPIDEPLEPVGPLDLWTSGPESTLDGNLELAWQRAQLETRVESADNAGDQGLPQFDLVARAGVASLAETASGAFTDLFDEASIPYASAGVELSMPLGGQRRASRDVARADVSALQARHASRERALQAEHLSALDDSTTAARRLTLAEQRLKVALATEDGERVRVDQGLRRLDELLAASAGRVSAEAAVADARVALARSHLDLATLHGVVSPSVGEHDAR